MTRIYNLFCCSYHRILRKEKTKKTKKALEELQKTDPEAYLDKLKRLEKDRIQVSAHIDVSMIRFVENIN